MSSQKNYEAYPTRLCSKNSLFSKHYRWLQSAYSNGARLLKKKKEKTKTHRGGTIMGTAHEKGL